MGKKMSLEMKGLKNEFEGKVSEAYFYKLRKKYNESVESVRQALIEKEKREEQRKIKYLNEDKIKQKRGRRRSIDPRYKKLQEEFGISSGCLSKYRAQVNDIYEEVYKLVIKYKEHKDEIARRKATSHKKKQQNITCLTYCILQYLQYFYKVNMTKVCV